MGVGRGARREPVQTHTILAIGDVAPGGSPFPCAERPLAIGALRDLIEQLTPAAQIVPLSPASLPSNPWQDRKIRQKISLAFIGAFLGHCEYVVPLLGARQIPAHFFVPLERVGLPGRASLRQLRECGEQPHARLEVDLSADPPRSLWGRVDTLRRAAATLASARGTRPRYVWFGSHPLDVRVRLLLAQTGYTAALTNRPLRAEARRDAPILEAWPIDAPAAVPTLDELAAQS